MAHNLTEVDNFTPAVTVPDGGDARTAASVELPFQAVANRTLYLKNKVETLGDVEPLMVASPQGFMATHGDVHANLDFEYCDNTGMTVTKPRTVMVPLSQAGTTSGWINAGGGLQATLAAAQIEIPLPIQSNCAVTMVRVAYDKNGATGGAPGFTVIRKVPNKGSPPSIGTQNTERADTDGTPGNAADAAQIMSTGTFLSTAPNLATQEWYIRVVGVNVGDVIYWVELSFNDFGPRNF